jgi:hypothetical protein
MSDTTASERNRRNVAQRWGNTKPIRLADELEPRAGELPADRRARLASALISPDISKD